MDGIRSRQIFPPICMTTPEKRGGRLPYCQPTPCHLFHYPVTSAVGSAFRNDLQATESVITAPQRASEVDARRQLGRLAVGETVRRYLAEAAVSYCRAGYTKERVVGHVVPLRPEIQLCGFSDVQREAAR